MHHSSMWLEVSGEQPLYLHSWLPDGKPRALLLLVHGMAEHAGRYARFAEALCQAGIGVFAHDQRGHGQTGLKAVPGHYADQGGWQRVIDDVVAVQGEMRSRYAETPMFLFGHSMGSYIAQGFLIRHGNSVQGSILCGSNYQSPWLYRLAQVVVSGERLRLGRRGRSTLFNRLTFGAFNRAIEPRRTEFDWLSRDPYEVDRYIEDPLCGVLCSNQLWLDLLSGLIEITNPDNLAGIDQNLPILVVGGSCDPVSDGWRLPDLAQAITRAGNRHTRLLLFAEARHELLNETNRGEVTACLLDWLEGVLAESNTNVRACVTVD